MDLYLMSPPHLRWSLRGRANPRSRRADAVDPVRARHEWLALAEGIEALGGVVAVLPPDETLTGLPFAAEAGLPLPPLSAGEKPRFLLPRMHVEHRRAEREAWTPFVESLGFAPVEIEEGTWEGQGDVATCEGVTLLFWGGRTDLVGARAAKRHMSGEILEIQVSEPAFHGNMAVLPLPISESLIVCADVVDDDSLAMLETRFGRDRMHFVSEEEIQAYSTNGLPIGDTILCPSSLPDRVRRLITREGMKVAELKMIELCEKAGGASRCLVCVARDVGDAIIIPEDAKLSSWADELRRGA